MAIAGLIVATGCASSSSPVRSGGGVTPLPQSSPSVATGSYAVRGLATYYGAKYQGRTTASGEPFDKEAWTAAHETLAFGTKVRVTNLDNGRSVVVRINDRFKPFKGRIIDLSERSFRQLAALEQGVIPVTLEVVR